jgi:signal peptidase I
MTIRWFLSGKVREATEAYKQVLRLLNAQRDILSQQAIGALEAELANIKAAIDSNADTPTLKARIDDIEKTAEKWLKPYPSPGIRENIEVFLVAIAVAMAIRTFFLQPFKIPTGSMQPTLYGVTTESFRNQPDVKFPTGWARFVDGVVRGTFYHHLVAKADTELLGVRHQQVARFINKHELFVREKTDGGWVENIIPVWFSPDERFVMWAGLRQGQVFRTGEDIFKIKEVTGDHLFVDRLSYNFRRPNRGDIVVFATKGTAIQEQNLFYIKRLVAMSGETITIGPDRIARIDGKPLNQLSDRFANLYNFNPEQPPDDSKYSGHVPMGFLDRPGKSFAVRTNNYFVMGDNTVSSSDSRMWGDFPRENVIGQGSFVYWPISNRGGSRFGWGYQ